MAKINTVDAVDLALPIIIDREGLDLTAYYCPAGVLTIGYGHTGKDVKPGMTITKEQATKLLINDATSTANEVASLSPVLTEHPKMFAAVISFAYNVGGPKYASSTLRKLIDKKEFKNAAKEFDKWVYAGGKKLEGLITRRKMERKLFEEGIPS